MIGQQQVAARLYVALQGVYGVGTGEAAWQIVPPHADAYSVYGYPQHVYVSFAQCTDCRRCIDLAVWICSLKPCQGSPLVETTQTAWLAVLYKHANLALCHQ